MILKSLKNEVEEIFNNYDDSTKKREATQSFFVFLIIGTVGFIIMMLNLSEENIELMYTPAILSLLSFIGILLVIKKRVKLSGVIMCLEYITVFMSYFVLGFLKGYSIIWCLIIPLSAFILLGIKKGVVVNIINILLVCIILNLKVHGEYYFYNFNGIFIKEFPMMLCTLFFTAYIMEKVRDIDFNNLLEANNSLEKLVYSDGLTGAPNFNKFQKDAKELLENNLHLPYVVVAIDVDTFKVINDKYGYKFGNEILINIADELKKICGENEIYAREGADHFVMLLTYENINLLELRIMNINERLRHCNQKNIIRLSYGIYNVDDRSADISTLYDRALMAKSNSKGNDLIRYSFYNERIRKKLLSEKYMEESMDSALINKEFVIYYQPKYNLKKGKYGGAEALVRWHKKDGSIVPPSEFISFFEKKGFITKVDMYVLKEVCSTLRRWIDEGIEIVTVSVNISKIDFYKGSLLSDIIEIVDRYKIPHKYIELEMTETIAAENLEEFINFADRCREAGFSVSMDDFGSGYSSLTMMKELNIDIIKLDKSMFSDNIIDERFNKAKIIIEHIIDLSKQLNIKVVAEGIESKELVDILIEMNCDMIQGYYYGKPMLANEFKDLISK